MPDSAKPRSLVLASASPQRRKLLASMGLRFEVLPSGAPEPVRGKDWRRLARGLALRKARSVARRRPDSLVVGADTVVVCGGRLLLKPRDRAHSLRMLKALSGRWHRVHTGVALVWRGGGVEKSGVETTRCLARSLTDERLERLAGKHMDKSGSYAVQDAGDPLIERIVGPRDNVIGFPRELFRRLAKNAGLKLEGRKR
jgi:septum formation protein